MQTDTWLTDTSYPDRCTLCSQPLTGGSNICPSCGFTARESVRSSAFPTGSPVSKQPDPITPIPARASAHRAQSKPGVVPRRMRSGTSSASPAALPTPKTEGWRHKSANYEVASSLSSLSLIISETPTAPPRSPRANECLEHIDEIDTVPQASGQARAVPRSSARSQPVLPDIAETPLSGDPPPLRFDDLVTPSGAVVLSGIHPPLLSTYIDEIDTVPEGGQNSVRALALSTANIDEIDTVPEGGQNSARTLVTSRVAAREVAVDAASWTAGPVAASSLAADLIAARNTRHQHRARIFNPLDRTRWWLLRPGHIEFLLWTVGSLFLFGITLLILLATILSVMIPNLPTRGNFPTSAVNAAEATPAETQAASGSVHLILSGKTALPPGAEIRLQGEGFHPQSQVVFLLDGRLALLDQHGQAATIQTDTSGHFVTNVWLGQGPSWTTGSHQLLARETASGRQIGIAITITAVSTTPVTNNSGVQDTPPAYPPSTPVPPSPTSVPSSPTTTPAVTPTSPAVPSPTPGKATATPALPVSTSTPADSSALGNSLNNEQGDVLFARLAHLNPLVWLIGVCYFISMLLLGLAGLLRRRHR